MMSDIYSISNDLIIGTVREIKGTKAIIRMFENTSQIVHLYNGERYSGIMIGSFVGIKRGQYIIVGKVEKEYAFDLLNDVKTQVFSNERFVREIEIKIIGSFKNMKYISGMVAFPQIFNDVILLSDKQTRIVVGGGGKNTPNDGLPPSFSIGKLWPEGIDYYIKWYNIFNTHIAIFGNTGSGKSNTLTKLYHELFELEESSEYISFGNSKFVFIDFNGEYTESETITTNKKVYRLSTSRRSGISKDLIEIPENRFWDVEMLAILFGATEQTQQPFLKRVIKFYFQSDEDFKDNLPNYFARAFEDVYTTSNKYGLDLLKQILTLLKVSNDDISTWINLTQVNNTQTTFYSDSKIDEWNGKEGQKYYWNQITEVLDDQKVKVERSLKISLLGRSMDDTIENLQIAMYLQMIFELRYNTIQYDHVAPLLHRVESRVNEFASIFSISYRCNKVFDDNNVIVVSLKDVTQDMKLIVPMLIAKLTYAMNKDENIERDRIFNLVIDEAHNILSEKSSRESEKWKDYRLEVFEEIIKEGRKFGYYLTISSQRPADISPTIVSQVHNYFIHRLVNDNDLKLLDRTMGSLDYVSRESIPNLAPGQAILTGSSFELPVIVQVEKLNKKIAPNSDNPVLLNIWKLED